MAGSKRVKVHIELLIDQVVTSLKKKKHAFFSPYVCSMYYVYLFFRRGIHGTRLLEFSIGRDFGGSKGITAHIIVELLIDHQVVTSLKVLKIYICVFFTVRSMYVLCVFVFHER